MVAQILKGQLIDSKQQLTLCWLTCGLNLPHLAVNQPKCPFHNNHNDGAMNFMHKNEEVRALKAECGSLECVDVLTRKQSLCDVRWLSLAVIQAPGAVAAMAAAPPP